MIERYLQNNHRSTLGMTLSVTLGYLMLYILETHPTWRHPTRSNDELTRRAWNQRGAAQVIQYEIYIYNYVN